MTDPPLAPIRDSIGDGRADRTTGRHRNPALEPKQLSTGDRTILASISKRRNRYLRGLFVQAAWVVLVKIGPKH